MLLNHFLKKDKFIGYDDFCQSFAFQNTEHFHFVRDVIDVWAAAAPNKKALLWCNDDGESKTFTFRDISEESKRYAAFFAAKGLKKGDRVMLLLRRRYEYWMIAPALHRLGIVVIPASVQLSAKDIVYRVNVAQIKMIVALNDAYVIEEIELARAECPNLLTALVNGAHPGFLDMRSEMQDLQPLQQYPEFEADDPFILYFTSGTTGMPKAVVHNQLYPLGHIVTAKYMQCVEENGLHLTVSDTGWAKFGWGCLYGQWICGSCVLGYDPVKFHAETLIQVIRKFQPTTLCVPPTIYRFMLKAGITREDFASVHHCATAGEPLSPAVSKEFENITGLTIHEGFGQSEGTVLVCNFPFDPPRFGSMGRPSPAFDVHIINEEGKECGVNEPGELVLFTKDPKRIIGLTVGYLQDGKVEKFYSDIYHTKDIVYKDESGYLYYIGRNDDVIKSSGYRIGPYEIESVLNTHPAVFECSITGEPDPIRGQIICANIILAKNYTPSESLTKELQQHVKTHTAPYKYPRVIHYVDEIPKTISGKIKRYKKA